MTDYHDMLVDMVSHPNGRITVPVTIEIHPMTCGGFGPFRWGRIRWGHRNYWCFGCFFFVVWL